MECPRRTDPAGTVAEYSALTGWLRLGCLHISNQRCGGSFDLDARISDARVRGQNNRRHKTEQGRHDVDSVCLRLALDAVISRRAVLHSSFAADFYV